MGPGESRATGATVRGDQPGLANSGPPTCGDVGFKIVGADADPSRAQLDDRDIAVFDQAIDAPQAEPKD